MRLLPAKTTMNKVYLTISCSCLIGLSTQIVLAQNAISSNIDAPLMEVVSTRILNADGPDAGLDTYSLIRNFGGPNPIESPDFYPDNHPGVAHIFEDYDAKVGNHFVFTAHRDIDRDRDRYDITDRQRNEIKTYASSEDAVKGYQNETMLFSWKFKIDKGLEVSRRFTHLFQLKAVGGNDSQPIITFTANERSLEDGMEIRHVSDLSGTLLARVGLDEVEGVWLRAQVRATFAEQGSLSVLLTRLSDGEVIFDLEESDLDMWRGVSSQHFVRPKWGIYRSLDDFENLRAEEEIVRFANFEIQKLKITE